MLLGACGGGAGSNEKVVLPDVFGDLVERARAAGYVEQAAVLETGNVTSDDLLAAISAARGCVTDLGFEVSEIARDSRGSMSYNFTLPEGANTSENVAKADECQARYSMLIEQAYDHLNPMDDGPIVDRIASCAASQGAPLDSGVDTLGEIQDEVAAARGSVLEDCYVDALSNRTIVLQ